MDFVAYIQRYNLKNKEPGLKLDYQRCFFKLN